MIRATSFLTLALGATVTAWAISRAVGATPPPLALTITLAGAGVLTMILGVGIARRSRVAWSFMLSIAGVGAVALLLSLPAMMRGGVGAVAGLAMITLVGVILALLVMLGDQVKA